MTNVLNNKKLEFLEGYVPAAEVARENGLHRSSISQWLRRQGLLSQCKRVGQTSMIPLSIVEQFMQHSTKALGITRAPARPKGWVPLKAAAIDFGCSPDLLRYAIQKKEVEAVWFQKVVWCNPRDLERLRLVRFGNKPLPGYVLLNSTGCHPYAFSSWAQKRGVPIKKFWNPETNTLMSYVLQEHRDQYLAWSAENQQVPVPLRTHQELQRALREAQRVPSFSTLYRALALKAQSGKASELEQELLRGLHEQAFSPRDWQKGIA